VVFCSATFLRLLELLRNSFFATAKTSVTAGTLHEKFFTPHYCSHRAILGAGTLLFLWFKKIKIERLRRINIKKTGFTHF
jgi:hypothetical protein